MLRGDSRITPTSLLYRLSCSPRMTVWLILQVRTVLHDRVTFLSLRSSVQRLSSTIYILDLTPLGLISGLYLANLAHDRQSSRSTPLAQSADFGEHAFRSVQIYRSRRVTARARATLWELSLVSRFLTIFVRLRRHEYAYIFIFIKTSKYRFYDIIVTSHSCATWFFVARPLRN